MAFILSHENSKYPRHMPLATISNHRLLASRVIRTSSHFFLQAITDYQRNLSENQSMPQLCKVRLFLSTHIATHLSLHQSETGTKQDSEVKGYFGNVYSYDIKMFSVKSKNNITLNGICVHVYI